MCKVVKQRCEVMMSLSGTQTLSELCTMQFPGNKSKYIAEKVYHLKREHRSLSDCSSLGIFTAISMVVIER